MNFYSPDAKLGQAVDFSAGVGDAAGVNASESDEAIGVGLAVVGDPVVNNGRETDDFGRDVIDQAGALDVDGIEISQEIFGMVAVAFDFVEVRAAAGDELESVGLHHVVRDDVNVNVDDRLRQRGSLTMNLRPTDCNAG